METEMKTRAIELSAPASANECCATLVAVHDGGVS